MHDFQIIGTGEPGGKGRGLIGLRDALSRTLEGDSQGKYSNLISIPKTAIVQTEIFREFVEHNGLDDAIEAAQSGNDVEFEILKKRFLEGSFPNAASLALLSLLDVMRKPLAVRSSSLLEDQKGASFAGKYESVFVGNNGDEEAKKSNFLSAIKTVFASTCNPDAVAYRKKHNLIGEKEEMALVIQEVVGLEYKGYFLPALSGVAFSQNGYCWNKEINKKDGLVRLVMGLGTRAVGRGYVRLFSPAKPLMRPEGTEVNNIQKCSQKKVDVVDLKDGHFKTVHFRELIMSGFDCYPGSQAFVSLRDGNYLYRPVSNLWDVAHIPVLTLDGVLSGSWMGIDFGAVFSNLLADLERTLGFGVDMEFAVNVDPEKNLGQIFLLQARPLSEGENRKPMSLPQLKDDDVIFLVNRNLPTAYVPEIEYLVFVDDSRYHDWPHGDKQSIARAIGKVSEALKGKKFALIGPGRWGSWNPELGVPVSYAEIAGTALLIEVARRKATYVPEVSFGSHFFQDLIEDNITYLPVYPDEAGEIFNEEIFKAPSSFGQLLDDPYYRKFDDLIKIIHIPSVADGRKAFAILNGELEKAVVFLK